MTYQCVSCRKSMRYIQVPQICEICILKGGSGSDPDYNSRTDYEYCDFYISFDEDQR